MYIHMLSFHTPPHPTHEGVLGGRSCSCFQTVIWTLYSYPNPYRGTWLVRNSPPHRALH